MRRKNLARWSGLAGLLLVLMVPTAAGAQTRDGGRNAAAQVERRSALASFEGRTIDLAADWEGAAACLVWRQGGVLQCFRDAAELDALEARLSKGRHAAEPELTASIAAYSGMCGSSLRLYEHNYYGGRKLSFWDRGYWQNLSDYGFEDRTSSYIVGACYVHLAEHANGGGWWYSGPTYPYAGEPVMGVGWQDVISSIYID